MIDQKSMLALNSNFILDINSFTLVLMKKWLDKNRVEGQTFHLNTVTRWRNTRYKDKVQYLQYKQQLQLQQQQWTINLKMKAHSIQLMNSMKIFNNKQWFKRLNKNTNPVTKLLQLTKTKLKKSILRLILKLLTKVLLKMLAQSIILSRGHILNVLCTVLPTGYIQWKK